MTVSIKERTQHLPNVNAAGEHRKLLEAVYDALIAVADKLDTDSGVTATDFADAVRVELTK